MQMLTNARLDHTIVMALPRVPISMVLSFVHVQTTISGTPLIVNNAPLIRPRAYATLVTLATALYARMLTSVSSASMTAVLHALNVALTPQDRFCAAVQDVTLLMFKGFYGVVTSMNVQYPKVRLQTARHIVRNNR